jgi:cobalt-zinc-cadmium efflux system protein
MHQTQTFHCPDCVLNQPAGQQPGKIRRLWIAFVLLSGFAAGEYWAGTISHSLALQAEAGHMTADCIAIALALFAAWIAQLSPSHRATFGYRRAEILAALLNGVGLFVVGGLIAWEALEQLQTPPDGILSQPMLITATVGLGVNTLNALLLHQHSQMDLNLRGAFLHMVADAVSSIGVILAAIAVWRFHWLWADSMISFAVAGLIMVGAIPLIRQSLNVLLEQVPHSVDAEQIQTFITGTDGVDRVTDLRVWSIATGQVALTASLEVHFTQAYKRDRLLQQLQASLREEFGICDVVIQMTTSPAALLRTLPNTELHELIRQDG